MHAFPPLNANDAEFQYTRAGIWQHPNGNFYKYMKYDAGTAVVTGADGMVVYYVDTTGWMVTPDVSDASNVQVAAVMQDVIDDMHWGWFQVGGVHDAVWTSGSVIDGGAMVGHTVDGQADLMADGEEEQVFAVALAADTADPQPIVAAKLRLNF